MIPKASVIPVFIPHLGCPNNCVFCNQNRISGAEKPVTPEEVRNTIQQGLKLSKGKPQLAFYGGSFTAISPKAQEEYLSVAKEFVDTGDLSLIRLSTRPDAIDENTLDRLERFGVKIIELGAQSMDDDVLAKSGRGHTSEDVKKASKLIKSRGFSLILQMMTGLPGDTLEKTVNTAKEIIALNPDGVRIYPTVIVSDTPLFELWKRGLYREHTVDEAVKWCSVIYPMFNNAGIPVIRMGLNPTDDLSAGKAEGGAYHPAFGELVRSKIYLDRINEYLDKNLTVPSDVIIEVNPKKLSRVKGNKNINTGELEKNPLVKSLQILPQENAEDINILIKA